MSRDPDAQEPRRLSPLVAIIGCDGSGKSTVSEEVLAWIRPSHAAELAHLGKQSGNVGRAIARLPLVGKPLDRVIRRKAKATRAERGTKTPGVVTALVICGFSIRRLLRFRRMMKARRRGLIIVTDRYPQLELPAAYDGSGLAVDAPRTSISSGIVLWLARRERRAYVWMTSFRPDLVLRLNVDLDVACARKPDHRRELLARKIGVTPKLTFNGAHIVEIDANRSLAEVLVDAKAAVQDTLTALDYPLKSS